MLEKENDVTNLLFSRLWCDSNPVGTQDDLRMVAHPQGIKKNDFWLSK
jgi:hypothetical protein